MKYLFFSLISVMFFSVYAQNSIDITEVKRIALNFSYEAQNPRDSIISYLPYSQGNDITFYLLNYSDSGFVIIPNKRNLHPIFAFSFRNSVDINNISLEYKLILDSYSNYVYNTIMDTSINSFWKLLSDPDFLLSNKNKSPSIQFLLSTEWGQLYPYNIYTPVFQNFTSVAGCVPVALSQIVNFWEYPRSALNIKKYLPLNSYFGEQMLIPENFSYDYTSFPNSITEPITYEDSLLAQFIYHIGILTNSNFGSGQEGTSSNFANIKSSLDNNLGYDYNFLDRSQMSVTTWKDSLYSSLSKGYPILYLGTNTNGYSHAWVIDGYEEFLGESLFHMNYGWGGINDGYYNLDLCQFQLNQFAFQNLKPKNGFCNFYADTCTVLSGDTIQLEGFSNFFLDTASQWTWEIDSVIYNGREISVILNTSGSYDVTLKVSSATDTCELTRENYLKIGDKFTKFYISNSGNNSNPGTYSLPFQTVSYALSKCDQLDTLLLFPGEYFDNILISDQSIYISNINQSELREDLILSCTINGNTGDACRTVTLSNSDVKIHGLTIKNGGINSTCSIDGGGVLAANSNLIFDQVYLMNNKAYEKGGGIYLDSSKCSLLNSKIYNNISQVYGGGMYISYSEVELINTQIYNDSAFQSGGGIYAISSMITTNTSKINSCYSYYHGGGIFSACSFFELNNDSVINNESYVGGGGYFIGNSLLSEGSIIYNSSAFEAGGLYSSLSPIIDSKIFLNATVNNGGGIVSKNSYIKGCFIEQNSAFDGGGIYILNESNKMYDNEISGNIAQNNGGGVYCLGEILRNNITSLNNEISKNIANNNGGGAYFKNETIEIFNNLFEENEANCGAGCYFDSVNLCLDTSNFSSNFANSHGGGIFLRMSPNTNINGVDFISNSADYGGGLYLSDISDTVNTIGYFISQRNLMYFTLCKEMIKYTTFENNSSLKGGAAYIENSIIKSDSVKIINNHSNIGGGVFYFRDTIINNDCVDDINNKLSRIVLQNNHSNKGGGLFLYNENLILENALITNNIADTAHAILIDDSKLILLNSTLANNTSDTINSHAFQINSTTNSSNLTVVNSILWDKENQLKIGNSSIASELILINTTSYDTIESSTYLNVNNNYELHYNPNFINDTLDYHLLQNSDCIDLGVSNFDYFNSYICIIPSISFSFEEEPLNNGNRVNIGCYANSIEATESLLSSQEIPLEAGWSMFSTYIDPYINDIDSILSPILSSFRELKDEDNNQYYPASNIYNIENFTKGKGYKIYMLYPDTLTIQGYKILPEINKIPIRMGWSFLGYLRSNLDSIEYNLGNVLNNVQLVKNEDGVVYWPGFVYQLLIQEPGEGYEISMYQSDTLVYPSNSLFLAKSEFSTLKVEPRHFNISDHGIQSMQVGIYSDAYNFNIKYGDEIGVFNSSNELIGAGVFEGRNLAIDLWETTNNVTITKYEKYQLKYYDNSNDETQHIEYISFEIGDDNYENNKIAIINKLDIKVENHAFPFHPNPTSGEVSFDNLNPKNVQVFDCNGVLVNEFNQVTEKLYLFHLKPGFYTLIIRSEIMNNPQVNKLIIIN